MKKRSMYLQEVRYTNWNFSVLRPPLFFVWFALYITLINNATMLLAKNRKALFNYEIIEKYLAGVVLKGYEVKAIREGKVNFEGSYIATKDGEVFVLGMKIARYSKQSQKTSSEDADRPRKLLLNKNEIEKISKHLNQKGKTAVPLALLLKNNIIKLELAVVKGRSKYGKKHLEKERQIEKDLRKAEKGVMV